MTDTPAPIATPEEITEKIEHAFAGYASEIAAGVNELVAAALASSNAEIERVKRENAELRAVVVPQAQELGRMDAELSSLTAQVGRMTPFVQVLAELAQYHENDAADEWLGSMFQVKDAREARAALSPTEPEGTGGFDIPREELDAGHEAWVERQERAADTPAPIDTPEETGKRIALSGGSITLPFDIESEEDPVPVQFHSRKKLAAQIADAIRAALASSNAEIERLKERLRSAEATVDTFMRAQEHYREAMDERNDLKNRARAAEAQVAALTDQVGRLREALDHAEHLLRHRDRQAQTHRKFLMRDIEEALAGDLRSLRNRLELMKEGPVTIVQSDAALSPTEPEGKT